MRRIGVRASLQWNFIIHQIFHEFLQSFQDLKIVTQNLPFDRGLFILFVLGIWLAWFSTSSPFLSSTNSHTGTGEMSLLRVSSLSRTGISPTVDEESEDEEDEERLSCFMDVRKIDEDPEDELDKPGTTIGTKFSVLQIIRIPSLMRCGF